ncbi:o-succinylbenzoate synthase [Shewanella colwelliana]|uniref:o-succinylbenzoate synthase n=1 Tax=Shewanella colwelliana TaxID=23 RepID=A0A1E5IW95_SHECO|nr:o-succinylbenzoate synthase [Shewanella colwelliana]OEG74822.1 o-succinylbenzoate synthase [Shewanella colwelliana]
MNLTSLTLLRYQLPLDKLLPVGKHRIDTREGLVLQATSGDQQHSVEIAPLSGIDIDGQALGGFSQESLQEVSQCLLDSMESLINQPIDKLLDLAEQTNLPSMAFGLSLLHAKLKGHLSHSRHNLHNSIPLLYRRQDEPIEYLTERVSQLAPSIHRVKIKVGQTSMEDEIQLIHHVLAIRPDLKLRLDANQAFELEQAIEFCACLPLDAVEYIEEPCKKATDNQHLFNAIGIPYALDESLNDPNYQFSMLPGLTALILKPMLIGSIEHLQALIDTAHSHGVRTIMSSSLETSLGIDALRVLSQALTPDEPPGLDTLSAFNCDLIVSSGKVRCLSAEELTLLSHLEAEI